MIDDNSRYLITDFGISKKIRSTMRKQSQRGVGAGATAYMGPERFDSDPTPVKASDIWSLGVSIYELATGELPFNGMGGIMQKNGAELPELDDRWSNGMKMVMQSCLAKETWDRPTAEQLEKYSESILKGEPAVVTWRKKNEVNPNPVPSHIYEGEEEVRVTNRNRTWIAFGFVILVIIVLIEIWPSNKKSNSHENKQIYIENFEPTTANTIENGEIETQNVESDSKIIKLAEESNINQKPTTPLRQEETQKNSSADVNATLLKKALSEEDYVQIQKLANKGYAPAYGPLAQYYLKNHDYKTAETYAKKAQAAGIKEGAEVIKTLHDLRYYD